MIFRCGKCGAVTDEYVSACKCGSTHIESYANEREMLEKCDIPAPPAHKTMTDSTLIDPQDLLDARRYYRRGSKIAWIMCLIMALLLGMTTIMLLYVKGNVDAVVARKTDALEKERKMLTEDNMELARARMKCERELELARLELAEYKQAHATAQKQ